MEEVTKEKYTDFSVEMEQYSHPVHLKHRKGLTILLMMPSGKETVLSLGKIP